MSSYRRKDINPSKRTGTVYLLHFERPYKHARHYIGFTERALDVRLGEHWRGNGSALTRAVLQTSIPMKVVRTWENVNQQVEPILKCRGESPKLCPVCNPDGWTKLATGYAPTGS